jgi:acyl transferase domain-containing protein/acyl carrier protein
MKTNPDIAIIGMSGLFPEASTLEAFRDNLARGRDSVREVSDHRKMYSCLDPSYDYQPYAYIDRIDLFDYHFFNIPKAEAEVMDPQQRLLLQLTAAAIENAGYSLNHFSGSRTGVFMTASPPGYKSLLAEVDAIAEMGNRFAAIAARIAYVFNLHGPALMIDTTCSSSLVAVAEACEKLQLGKVDYAIAGGISIVPRLNRKNQEMLFREVESPDGKSRAFDAGAGGTGGGEGGAVVVLKLLDDAVRDGDHVHAVIRGWAVNQDGGRTVGLTAPSPEAQTGLLLEAWRAAGVDPATISYVEAHGTGTRLGDPVEIRGLSDAFKQRTPGKKFCAVSALKSNIGHLDAAAGIAGLIKVVLSLKNKVLFPSLHFRTPNPLIDFENTAVYVNDRLRDWEAGAHPRLAGVSAFGLTGTNAHVLVQEAPARGERPEDPRDVLVTVSAKSRESLLAYLQNVKAYLDRTADSLADISFTLNAGRDDLPYRTAFVATSKADLGQQISQVLAGSEPGPSPAKARDLVFLLSGNAALGDELVAALAHRYDSFRNHWQACRRLAGQTLTGGARTFGFQYALLHLLREMGVSTDCLVASGVSNLVVQVLNGELPLDEGLAEAAGYHRAASAPNGEKLRQYLAGLRAPLCLELGNTGQLGQVVRALGVPHVPLLPEGTPRDVLTALSQLYAQGAGIDWLHYYRDQPVSRVELPTYPFAPTRSWFAEPLKSLDRDITGWFYDIGWVRKDAASGGPRAEGQTWMIVADAGGIAGRLADHLQRAGNTVIRVGIGAQFAQIDPYTYTVRAAHEPDYERLYERVALSGKLPDGVIHLGNCGERGTPAAGKPDDRFATGLYAQHLLTKALHPLLTETPVRLIFASTNAYQVAPEDNVCYPEKSSTFGYIKGIIGEYEKTSAKAIDLGRLRGETDEELADLLLAEMNASDYCAVAYREGRRYVQALHPLPSRAHADEQQLNLVEDGVYVVTGGTSGIGLEICKSLVARTRINLVVIGRTVLPEAGPGTAGAPGGAETGNSQKLENLRALSLGGSKVHYYNCDVANHDDVAQTFRRISQRHGPVRGIVHSAALPGAKRIKHNTLEEFRSVFASRAYGALSLVELTEGSPLDFLVIFASVSTILPPQVRKADYCAASVFADTYVRQVARRRPEVKVINWCDWQETGMSFRLSDEPEAYARELKFLHVKNKDGIRIFNYFVNSGYSNSIPFGNKQAITENEIAFIQQNPFFTYSESGAQFDPFPVAPVARDVSPAAPTPAPALPAGTRAPDTAGVIAGIWQEVLKVDQLAPEDNFFDLGGHSLNGFIVLGKLEKHFRVELEMEDLFDSPTLGELAARIDQLTAAPTGGAQPAPGPQPAETTGRKLKEAPLQDYYEVNHTQKAAWFKHQPGGPRSLNVSIVMEFTDLNLEVFGDTFARLVAYHEGLRTNFIRQGDTIRQQIHPFDPDTYRITYIDLRREENPEQAVDRLKEADSRQVFDLARGPLFTLKVLQVTHNYFVMLFTIHHIICDAWSIEMLRSQFRSLYTDALSGKENQLVPLPLQAKDYAHWEHEMMQTNGWEPSQRYWREKLAAPLPLFYLHPDAPALPREVSYAASLRGATGQFGAEPAYPAVAGVLDRTAAHAGTAHRVVLKGEAFNRLKAFGQQTNTSLFRIMTANWAVLLYKLTGKGDVLLGSTASLRDQESMKNVMGWFTNTVLFRIRVDGGMTVAQLLSQVDKEIAETLHHKEYPFAKILQEQDVSLDALGAVWLNYLNYDFFLSQDIALFEHEATVDDPVYFNIDSEFIQYRNGIIINSLYRADLFEPREIEQLFGNFTRLLDLITQDPTVTIDDLPL